ncbi:MAG: hypothetical protein D6753_01310 [Planctomycetota bacterium]|nr:MAG: hypothetical protein D6753_01310 [Planctomycetota bacterium]
MPAEALQPPPPYNVSHETSFASAISISQPVGPFHVQQALPMPHEVTGDRDRPVVTRPRPARGFSMYLARTLPAPDRCSPANHHSPCPRVRLSGRFVRIFLVGMMLLGLSPGTGPAASAQTLSASPSLPAEPSSGNTPSVPGNSELPSTPSTKRAIEVLTKGAEPADSPGHDLPAQLRSPTVHRVALQQSQTGDASQASRRPSVLARGDQGAVVEALQRTLNVRHGEDLAVDGDFGPATEAAVRRVQLRHGLEATGIVDEATWRVLGDLVMESAPVPPPEVVNSQTLPRDPPLRLDGPPVVSAKAWSILDRQSGRITAHQDGDSPLPMASTTKVMTALLILELAQRDPALLDQLVEFSPRADATPGSTAGVKAGESLTTRDLLYGLLLPSGNDASVALAEHFGPLAYAAFAGSTADPRPTSAYDQFVAAMNGRASALGLAATHFRNPNGLTEKGHHASANDLARLAHYALEFPLFRTIVNTRRFGCTVISTDGQRRNVVWNNTNRLLGQQGFNGVKTGTTSAAGACLIAAGQRGDSDQIVVVLGAACSDARYVDARNLFRWVWSQ